MNLIESLREEPQPSAEEPSPPVGRAEARCSNKGYLAMSLEDYLELLD